jgi:hypothetical protein
MRKIHLAVLFLGVSFALGSFAAEGKSRNPWNGIWTGSWDGISDTRVVIVFGGVMQFVFQEESQYIAFTRSSGNELRFTLGAGRFVTMKLIGPNIAAAAYHGKTEMHATLVKEE